MKNKTVEQSINRIENHALALGLTWLEQDMKLIRQHITRLEPTIDEEFEEAMEYAGCEGDTTKLEALFVKLRKEAKDDKESEGGNSNKW